MHKMEGLSFFSFVSSFIVYLSMELSLAADTINPTRSMRDGETLVSSSQGFELGFFSPGSSKSRYLGLWYKEGPGQVVWVANRNKPILDSHGVLSINNYGNLVLLDKKKGIIWSGNASRKVENPVAQLLDSGNLVLRDNFSTSSEIYLWQSFDYPSDTLLPGMKLGWDLKTGLQRYLTSWRSADDPSPGDFTFRLDIHVLPQMTMYRGSGKMTRTGPWNGVFFGGIPKNPNLLFEPVLVHNEDELYYSYDFFNNPVIMLLKLNQSGNMQCLIWMEKTSVWDIIYTAPRDACGIYGNCGANSVCSIDKTPICECLKGFVPQLQYNQTLPKTCVRSVPLNCERGDGFLQVGSIKLPDLLEVSLIEGISLKECEAKCLKNCSCRAYANSDIREGGRGCLMWFGDLIDIRKHIVDSRGQEVYIRVPASELGPKKKVHNTILVVSVISVIFIAEVLIFRLIWKKMKQKAHLTGQESRKEEDVEVPLFDLSTIAAATNNFSQDNLIGSGGFGSVYKGNLSTGEEIAAKRLSKNSRQGAAEFKNEVILIAKLQHRNLVGLLGSCIQGEERLLIYEYMPNRSLDYLIFDQNKAPLLTWPKRFDIVTGIARGLLYLHQDSKLQIIHRDLKASNILLDNSLKPKISDFGLARIFRDDDQEEETTRVAGTYGYMSPEYAIEGTYSIKSDIFSFGVILLEIISGKRNRGFSHPAHHHNLLGHAWMLWNEKRALELIDPCFEDSCVNYEALRCVQVGLLCVQNFPEDRPAMSSVVLMLSNMGATLPEPKQPGFFSLVDMPATSRKEELYSNCTVTITVMEGR
ncbi:hypothetical protein ACOSP7_030632 [Xanthoceras sorbifolium]